METAAETPKEKTNTGLTFYERDSLNFIQSCRLAWLNMRTEQDLFIAKFSFVGSTFCFWAMMNYRFPNLTPLMLFLAASGFFMLAAVSAFRTITTGSNLIMASANDEEADYACIEPVVKRWDNAARVFFFLASLTTMVAVGVARWD